MNKKEYILTFSLLIYTTLKDLNQAQGDFDNEKLNNELTVGDVEFWTEQLIVLEHTYSSLKAIFYLKTNVYWTEKWHETVE